MSAHRIGRALARLASPGAVLTTERGRVGFGVFAKADRRRRAIVRLSVEEVRVLEAEGALVGVSPQTYVLSAAGASRVRREAAENSGETFVAQHAPVANREIVTPAGELRSVRGVHAGDFMRRLSALRGDAGPWLSDAELTTANRLRHDWATAEIGVYRGSDWSAAPIGSSARGANNAQEAAMARRCDAQRRLSEALASLAPPLRRVVERVCLYEEGLEALERAEGWPARSGKLALKLGLAQLAASD